MGSGVHLHRAFRKYGIQNFKKEVLRVCKTREDALDLESWIVSEELVTDSNCYNIVRGGGLFNWHNSVVVKDKLTNKIIILNKNDNRLNSGNYESIRKGFTLAFDTLLNKFVSVSSDDYNIGKGVRYISKLSMLNNRIPILDDSGSCKMTSTDEYYSGEYTHKFKGTINCRNILTNECKRIKLDEYYKNKVIRDSSGNIVSGIYDKSRIYKNDKDKYVGFIRERGTRKMYKDGVTKFIGPNDIDTMLSEGWVFYSSLPKDLKDKISKNK